MDAGAGNRRSGAEAMFFNNGDVREEFVADDHYVVPARNRPAPSFRVVVDCHEGYMVLVRAKTMSTQNRFGW